MHFSAERPLLVSKIHISFPREMIAYLQYSLLCERRIQISTTCGSNVLSPSYSTVKEINFFYQFAILISIFKIINYMVTTLFICFTWHDKQINDNWFSIWFLTPLVRFENEHQWITHAGAKKTHSSGWTRMHRSDSFNEVNYTSWTH